MAKAYDIDLNMSDDEIALELMRRSAKMAMSKTKKKKKRKGLLKKEVKVVKNKTDMEELSFIEL